MRNALVIFKREMAAYFNSPIAYIFIIVFLALNAGLYMTSFFLQGQADMRQLFSSLPLFLIFFIPALTMRLWAEDRRSGTFELLMTLPMRTGEVMAGKYLAALAFYLIALAGTLRGEASCQRPSRSGSTIRSSPAFTGTWTKTTVSKMLPT